MVPIAEILEAFYAEKCKYHKSVLRSMKERYRHVDPIRKFFECRVCDSSAMKASNKKRHIFQVHPVTRRKTTPRWNRPTASHWHVYERSELADQDSAKWI